MKIGSRMALLLKEFLRKEKAPSQTLIQSSKVRCLFLIVLVFMKITVNGEEKLSNFPADVAPEAVFEGMTPEERKELEAEEGRLYKFHLDCFTLPSIVRKVVKSMKKSEVCELRTNRVDKLLTFFPNEVFDQYKLFKEGDQVSFHMGLVWISKDEYFY